MTFDQLTSNSHILQYLSKTASLQEKKIKSDLNQTFGTLQTTLPSKPVNIYLTVSGASYEVLALHQIYQLLTITPNENYQFFLLEGIFLSPDFKLRLQKLQKEFKNRLMIQYVNYAWPEELVHLDFSPRRQINLYRIMFLDQIFPPWVDRVIYKDADQCSMEGSDFKVLQEFNMNGIPYLQYQNFMYCQYLQKRIQELVN